MKYVLWAFAGGQWQALPVPYASYAAAWREVARYRENYGEYLYVVRSNDQHPGDCT